MSAAPDRSAAFARRVSIVAHPFVVFAALALAATWKLAPEALPRTAIGLGAAIAVVWIFVHRRWRSGRWSTVDASRRQDRPLLYAVLLAVLAGFWLWMSTVQARTADGALAVGAMLCVAGVANRWIKLSLHMASLSFAGIVLLRLWPVAGGLMLACLPLLGWARLRMARHTWREVAGGTLLGAAAGMSLLLLR